MPHILLMGGGHCAKAIAEACKPLDWSYSVQDSRAEYAELEGATETHHSCPKDFLMANKDSLSRFSDILLLGHDWKKMKSACWDYYSPDMMGDWVLSAPNQSGMPSPRSHLNQVLSKKFLTE